MTTWREFLVEHAKFPFPLPRSRLGEDRSDSTTDISLIEVGLLAPEWKAHYAVRDEHLLQKLCQTLDDILGDTHFLVSNEDRLLSLFGRRLQFHTFGQREIEDMEWSVNDGEAQSRWFLDMSFFRAASICLFAYGDYASDYAFHTHRGDHPKDRKGHSGVDFIGMVGDKPVVLTEAQSPSVMTMAGKLLPVDGLKLTWARGQPVVAQLLQNAALSLGLRKMEWMFLSCLNYWIVCRLVRRENVQKNVPVQTSAFDPEMKLDDIMDYDDDIIGSTNISPRAPTIHSRAITSGHAEDPGLLLTSSPPHLPKPSQVWAPLQPLPKYTHSLLPLCTKNGNKTRRLLLTQFLGFGSTGHVWKCRFDNHDGLYAIKVVEPLRESDVEHRQRFYNEVKVYSTLEKAYQSGKLRDRITPRFYGAFKGDGIYVLILELCDDTLQSWKELSILERTHIYGLVQDLHRVGIVHGDLEPRNTARVPGGGFRLIDFSESTRKHNCKELLGKSGERSSTRVRRHKCYELPSLRSMFKDLEERERVHIAADI